MRTLAADTAEPPTAAEIQLIESRIELPDGAYRLDEYVRFYYVVLGQPHRRIDGGYVAKHTLDSYGWPPDGQRSPPGQIAIVQDYEDVPAPYDAGCSVLRIEFVAARSKEVKVRCDPQLEIYPPSLA